ncbi:hypothetical protein [Xenorhabdus sp. SGI246]|uniref:hypothetical protein n=1 Tax=Xenorhabdus sp. SGI246 TaxID=3158263 RepID=UPI00349F0977
MNILRIFFGLFLIFFGLNHQFHFFPEPPWPVDAMNFLSALRATGYMNEIIMLTDVIAGALLVINILTPLALLLSASILAHSLLFHFFLAPETVLFAAIGAGINMVLIYVHRKRFYPLFIVQ